MQIVSAGETGGSATAMGPLNKEVQTRPSSFTIAGRQISFFYIQSPAFSTLAFAAD
jgi:hypothetical protein